MGHLVNPISSQIKHHGSWKITWSNYFRKDFAYFFFIDQYIKSLVYSLTFLKSFFNKFFFYELKYFLKNDYIFFFFSFKFLRKSAFKFYWKYIHKSRLLSRFISFSRKRNKQDKLERSIALSQFNELPMQKKIMIHDLNKYTVPFYILNNAISQSKNNNFKVKTDLFFRKFALNFLVSYFKLNFNLVKFNKTYKSIIFTEVSKDIYKIKNFLFYKYLYLHNSKLYGYTSNFALNSCNNFSVIRDLFSKGYFYKNVQICLMSDYFYKNNPYYENSVDYDFLFFNKSIKMIAFSKNLVSKFFMNLGKLLFRKFKLGFRVSRKYISKKLKKSLRELLRRLRRFKKNTYTFIQQMKKFLNSKLLRNLFKNEKSKTLFNLSNLKIYDKNFRSINWFGVFISNYK